jgi:hypothetical protein
MGHKKAKQKGLPLFVVSEPQARTFFVKLGFQDTHHVDMDLEKYAPEHCGFGNFRLSAMIYNEESS